MTITVLCRCGTRVRGDESRLRRRAPCPECGDPLPSEAEPAEKRIPFNCLCGVSMQLPASRGGLWFDCPQCGRNTVIPGFGSSKKRALPVDLPAEPVTPRKRSRLLVVILVAALTAAVAAALILT